MMSKRNPLLRLLPIALALLVAFGAGAILANMNRPTPGAPEEISSRVQAAPGPKVDGDRYAVADVVDRVSPAVVYVEVSYKQPRQRTRGVPGNDDTFGWFFGFPFSEEPGPQPGGMGSGVLISKDGYILTNQHVVDQADAIDTIKVTVQGQEVPFKAKLVGYDADLDLAVLKIDSKKALPSAELGNSDRMRVGEWVIAIGNPYQFDHTVTIGVLSAKGRSIQIPDRSRPNSVRSYENLMQTDAAINPGNSGGPLINMEGEVIGINTAINAAAQGIGFAIPINVAKRIQDDLINKGKVVRPFIGIEPWVITPDVVQYYGLTETEGVLIATVAPESPAAKTDLKPGDIIKEVNRKRIRTEKDWTNFTESMKIGDRVTFLINRNGRPKLVTLTIGERPQGL